MVCDKANTLSAYFSPSEICLLKNRPRALSLALDLAISFSLTLFSQRLFGWSADHSIAPYRNYNYRHCHVTARTARSRINETTSKSWPPPAPALHIARSATPMRHPPPFGHLLLLRRLDTSRSHLRTISSVPLSLSFFLFDSPPCDWPPTRFATLPLPNSRPSLYIAPSPRAGTRCLWKKHVFDFVTKPTLVCKYGRYIQMILKEGI